MEARPEYENELLLIFDNWQKDQKKNTRKAYDMFYNFNSSEIFPEIYEKYIALNQQDRQAYIDHLRQVKKYCLDMSKALHKEPGQGTKYFMAYSFLLYEIVKLEDAQDTSNRPCFM